METMEGTNGSTMDIDSYDGLLGELVYNIVHLCNSAKNGTHPFHSFIEMSSNILYILIHSFIDNNTSTVRANQPNEQMEKFNLLKLPRELLEEILIHLDNKDLLIASHVCKLFASVAETVFARIYSDDSYEIDGTDQLQKCDKVMLTKYGAVDRHRKR